MLCRGAPILAAVGASIALSTRASASPSAHLVYLRDATAVACPDESSLRQAVKLRVGYDPFFPFAKTTVVVEVAGDGQAFVARVRLVDEGGLSQGARELRSGAKGCGGLIDAAALAISIALDMSSPESSTPAPPSAAASASAPAPGSESASGPGDVPAPAPNPESNAASPTLDAAGADCNETRAKAATGRLHGLMGFDAVAAMGAAPTVVPGFDVWGAGRLGIGSLGLELRGDAPGVANGVGGGHASVVLFAATVAPCAHVGQVFACVLGTVDWLRASGDADVAHPSSGAGWALAVGPRAGAEVPLGHRWLCVFEAICWSNLLRPTVDLNDQLAWRLAPVSGVLAVGLAYGFP